MHKHYMTRQQTRAMALDHPIGDPTGGPAYGERRDPISAIVSVASMAGTYAAAGSFAAMTLTQGLVFAGGALSLAGNVTGNKTLSKLGMLTGLAGGAGMLAESITGTTIGSSLGSTFGFGETASGTGISATSSSGLGLTAPTVGNQAAGTVSPVADMARSPVEALAAADTGSSTAASLLKPGGGAAGSLNASPFTGQTSTGLMTLPGDSAAVQPAGLWDKAVGMGKDALQFAKDNPAAAQVMGNAAMGVADWLSGKTDAELEFMQANTDVRNAQAAQIQEAIANERRRRQNLNAGYQQVNQTIKVNPNANIPMPWQQGLIQGVMAPRPQGAPQ